MATLDYTVKADEDSSQNCISAREDHQGEIAGYETEFAFSLPYLLRGIINGNGGFYSVGGKSRVRRSVLVYDKMPSTASMGTHYGQANSAKAAGRGSLATRKVKSVGHLVEHDSIRFIEGR